MQKNLEKTAKARKKRMGRPPLAAASRRTVLLAGVRLTLAEYLELRGRARGEKKTVAAYVRGLLFASMATA